MFVLMIVASACATSDPASSSSTTKLQCVSRCAAAMLGLLVVVLLATPSLCNIDWDRPIDNWLDFAKRDLVFRNFRNIPVDDIVEDFVADLGFFKTRGRFVASEGSLSDITTLRRKSKVIVTRTGRVTRLTTQLGWDTLELTFGHFRVDMFSLHVEGDMRGKIRENCVEITLAFEDVGGECVTTVDDLKLVKFGDFDLKVNGLGSLNFLGSTILRMVAENNVATMAANTERKLKVLVTTSILDGYRCEEEASLLGLILN